MNRLTSTRGWPVRTAGLLLLAGLLLYGLPASAQAIKVTSALPDVTDQGTVGLVVTIGGENFAKGAKVNFYVTGTTNPGGIAVRNVNYKNAQTLEATIDVAPDAQTSLKFDIQVMSNGRTGKGTELFRVNVKATGQDTTPPGMVTVPDLQVTSIGFNTAVLSWTAPANDGYLVSSGPADQYDYRVRKAECGPYLPDMWGEPWTGMQTDPCFVYSNRGYAAAPGTPEARRVMYLSPVTEYVAAVRAVDDAGNWSALPDESAQLRFTTLSPPDTLWSAAIVDTCPILPSSCSVYDPRLGLDGEGNPAIFYFRRSVPFLASWTGSGWQTAEVGAQMDLGNLMYDFAFDNYGQAAAMNVFRVIGPVKGTKNELRFYRRTGATSDPWQTEIVAVGDISSKVLGFDPVSNLPTIPYQQNVKSNSSVIRLAQKVGSSWTIQDVASRAGGPLGLAFDVAGNPAVSYVRDVGGVAALGFARKQGSTWNLEQPEAPPGATWTAMVDTAIAFDPSRGEGDFAAVGVYRDPAGDTTYPALRWIRFCERTRGSWSCETIAKGNFDGRFVSLAFGADGTAYLSFTEVPTLFVAIRRPGETTWNREYAAWNAVLGSDPDIHVGPDGQPVIAYGSALDSTGVGGRRIAAGFTRRLPQ